MTGPVLAAFSDLDGTLIGTESANVRAYADAFRDAGLHFDETAYRAAFGLRFSDMIRVVAPGATEDQAAEITERKAVRYPQHFDRLLVNDGLVLTLRGLRAGGVPLGLVTTAARRNVDAILARTGLSELFDLVLTGDDVATGKPDPLGYRTACRLLDVDPAAAVVFEDSDVGVRAARAAGCAVVRVRLDEARG